MCVKKKECPQLLPHSNPHMCRRVTSHLPHSLYFYLFAVAMPGFTYERSAITTWLQRHATSPMTRAPIDRQTVPNHSAKRYVHSAHLLSFTHPLLWLTCPVSLFSKSGLTRFFLSHPSHQHYRGV